ncbi:glycosyltransferase family 39 protein [Breoghania sp.]|uniref:ArnT family glycosyltransferase n=1 Tax=Breoghania sp. TaxID=2065378 RepID=UPI002AA66C23|nr:glycosyltransferase family 39 protein [Breoghania sp.]
MSDSDKNNMNKDETVAETAKADTATPKTDAPANSAEAGADDATGKATSEPTQSAEPAEKPVKKKPAAKKRAPRKKKPARTAKSAPKTARNSTADAEGEAKAEAVAEAKAEPAATEPEKTSGEKDKTAPDQTPTEKTSDTDKTADEAPATAAGVDGADKAEAEKPEEEPEVAVAASASASDTVSKASETEKNEEPEGAEAEAVAPADEPEEPEGDETHAANDDAASAAPALPNPTQPRWLRVCGHSGLAQILLLLLALAVFVPGFWTVPPLDRDEPRFAQASKQMLETNDYVDIRFQAEPRYKKPVGIYWLQAAAAKATGYDADAPIWLYRLPSIVGAILAVLLTFWVARAFTGPPQAFLAGIFVALAIVVGVEARLAKTDAMLLAMILVSQGALARMWLHERAKQPLPLVLTFWIAMGLGVLIKGPVAPMIVGLTVIALSLMTWRWRWIRSLRPLWGLGILIVLAAPWFISIGLATKGAFFQEALGKDLFAKLGQGQESHGAPPLTHLAAMFGTFWPMPAFLVASLAAIIRYRKSALVKFCAAWVIPNWIVFEVVATKLPHYTMPLLPGLAILTAFGLAATSETLPRRWLRWLAAFLFALVPLGVAVASIVGPILLHDSPSPPGAMLIVFSAIAAIYAARCMVTRPMVEAIPRVILTTLLLYGGAWGFAMQDLKPVWISPRLAEAADKAVECSDPQIYSVGFNEPSFIFLTRTDTTLGQAEGAVSWIAEGGCRVATVESRYESEFLDKARAEGVALTLSSRVEGVNINGGHKLDIAVYKRTDM